MKWSISICAAALAISVSPLAAGAPQSIRAGVPQDVRDWKGRELTLRGCVQQGAKGGHYVLTQFAAYPPAGEAPLPKVSNGRRVIYWLEDLPNLKKYFNQMVEVKGEFIAMKESETETKIRDDGQLIVEFEGPGRDVDVTPAQVREVVGTSGTEPIKTLLVRVDVDDVKTITGSCN